MIIFFILNVNCCCGFLRTEEEAEWSQRLAGGPRIKLRDHSIDVTMLQVAGTRGEAAQGKGKMGHGSLWRSKWDLGSKDGGSQSVVGKLLAWHSLLPLY